MLAWNQSLVVHKNQHLDQDDQRLLLAFNNVFAKASYKLFIFTKQNPKIKASLMN
jgi:hypothetical protein